MQRGAGDAGYGTRIQQCLSLNTCYLNPDVGRLVWILHTDGAERGLRVDGADGICLGHFTAVRTAGADITGLAYQ